MPNSELPKKTLKEVAEEFVKTKMKSSSKPQRRRPRGRHFSLRELNKKLRFEKAVSEGKITWQHILQRSKREFLRDFHYRERTATESDGELLQVWKQDVDLLTDLLLPILSYAPLTYWESTTISHLFLSLSILLRHHGALERAKASVHLEQSLSHLLKMYKIGEEERSKIIKNLMGRLDRTRPERLPLYKRGVEIKEKKPYLSFVQALREANEEMVQKGKATEFQLDTMDITANSSDYRAFMRFVKKNRPS